MEVVARFNGRSLRFDPELERTIAAIVAPMTRRWRQADPEAVAAATRKQANVPEGGAVLQPVGTAPGAVVPPADGDGPTVVVLPGPPRELQAMWADAVATDEWHSAVGGHTTYRQHTLRLFGIPESEIAETLRVAEREVEGFDQLEITTCLRRAEVEVVTRYEPPASQSWNALLDLICARHRETLFSTDGTTIDEQVAKLLAGHRIALAESCTGGLMAARLTERAGSSDYVTGGVVSYSNDAKVALLGVDADLIERLGAVSPEVAEAMADGALARFEADVAVGITGVAGPGGGTDAKPVGYVCICAKTADGRTVAQDPVLPGNRAEIRDRSTTVAMHMLRRLLRPERE
jgi:nicotinamide-nucleotide amidase